MLQRKGTMPMLRNKKSNSRCCDIRMLRSRHFGHEITIASNLLKNQRPGEAGIQWQLPPHSKLQDAVIPSASVLLGDTNKMLQP
jgi:hypothetical protein